MQLHQHLIDNLRRLRMPGMIETLDLRVQQATEGAYGYVEFLQLLVQDELANREANNLAKRLKAANLSSRGTFESFDFRFNERALPPQTIRDLAACQFLSQNQHLILCGPPGVGPHCPGARPRGVPPRLGSAVHQDPQALGTVVRSRIPP